MNGLTDSIRPLILLLVSLLVCGGWIAPAAAYDFGQLQNPSSQPAVEQQNLTNQVQRLRQGTLEDPGGVEIDRVNQTLVWVVAAGQTLHVSTGSSPDLVPGVNQQSVTGTVIGMDLYPLSNHPGKALLSVNTLADNSPSTHLYALRVNKRTVTLEEIEQRSSAILRPLDGFVYGQEYGASGSWNAIYRYRTERTGYEPHTPLALPVDTPRLLSLTPIDGQRWSIISPDGDLTLLTPGRTLDTLSGEFGGTGEDLATKRLNSRRPQTSEPIRLAPTYLAPLNTLAVVRNPSGSGGIAALFGMSSNRKNTVIRLVEIRDDTLVSTASVGPLNGRIIDMEVPRANPRQLLWMRVDSSGTFYLEMLDLSGG
jgi:hypothetical protein